MSASYPTTDDIQGRSSQRRHRWFQVLNHRPAGNRTGLLERFS
jgi:hypothetical protein